MLSTLDKIPQNQNTNQWYHEEKSKWVDREKTHENHVPVPKSELDIAADIEHSSG